MAPFEEFVKVKFACQRIDCAAAVEVEVVEDRRLDPVIDFLPDGWGWDRQVGINAALHCPAHRVGPSLDAIMATARVERVDD